MTYEKTKERSNQIINAGYNLIEMWECVWTKNKEYRLIIKTAHHITEPLDPRDAFYGGRTNASKLKVQNKNCSILMFVVYTQLYSILIIILWDILIKFINLKNMMKVGMA